MSDEEHDNDTAVVHVEQMKVCPESTPQVDFIPCVKANSGLHEESDLEIQSMALEEIYPTTNGKGRKVVKFCGLDPTKKCWGTTVRCKQIILAASCFIFSILLVFFGFAIIPIKAPRNPINPLSNSLATTTGQIRVLLLGDSVLGIPSRKSGLVLKLGALLPQYFMNIAVSGKLGVKMFILLTRVDKILKKEKPDVVILYSDSDLSNQKEYTLSVQDKFDVRLHYRNNYTLVVERILATGAKLAISGPGLLGEAPLHQIPNPERFEQKDGMLDDYCQMVREIALKYNVPYLDIRGELQKAVPWWRLWYAGYVTKDGEHTNERGTLILAKVIANQLLAWFQTYDSSSKFRNYSTPATPFLEFELDDQTG